MSRFFIGNFQFQFFFSILKQLKNNFFGIRTIGILSLKRNMIVILSVFNNSRILNHQKKLNKQKTIFVYLLLNVKQNMHFCR